MRRYSLLICLLPFLMVGQAMADRISDTTVNIQKDPIQGFSGVYTEEWVDTAYSGSGSSDGGYDYFEVPTGYDYFERLMVQMHVVADSSAQVCSLRIWASSTDSTTYALDGATAGGGTKCYPLHCDPGNTEIWTFDIHTPKVSLKSLDGGDDVTVWAYYKR